MCAGCEQEQYIYKNIGGKKYCKSCTFKLEPPKLTFKVTVIKKVSEKQKLKVEEKKELVERDKEFYLKCWSDRFMYKESEIGYGQYHSEPRCEVCNKFLTYEPNLTYFHHILEKRNYPELRHEPKNIAIVCTECHNRYEVMPDMVPKLVERRNKLLASLL